MKAECTWGDGPDVLVILDGTPIMSYENPVNVSEGKVRLDKIPKDDEKLNWCTNGFIRQGSFDLTADQAETLGRQLILAAHQAKELDQSFEDYIINHEEMKSEIKQTFNEIEKSK